MPVVKALTVLLGASLLVPAVGMRKKLAREADGAEQIEHLATEVGALLEESDNMTIFDNPMTSLLAFEDMASLSPPGDVRATCLEDVTAKYNALGYTSHKCYTKNKCTYDVAIICGARKWIVGASREVQPFTEVEFCNGGCKVMKKAEDKALYNKCFMDVTARFYGQYKCVVSNNCPDTVVAKCGDEREQWVSKADTLMRASNDAVCAGKCTFTKPSTTRPSCLKDTTAEFNGEACILKSECTDKVYISCPSISATQFSVVAPGDGPFRPATTFGDAMCKGGCIYY